ncbi:MAG: hypothetical protein KOO63_07945 [Bacteroidales bacterium]|nr:hypothetical protein [Candidatus Latescibacterota bacterium]
MAIEYGVMKDEVQYHLEQQPTECLCNECGKDVDFEASVGDDQDLTIIAFRCECAIEEIDKLAAEVARLERELL